MHVMQSDLANRLAAWTFCVAIVWTSLGVADETNSDKLRIKKQYWQVLDSAWWVAVDHEGNPWFSTPDGDVAASYEKPIHTVAPYDKMILGDRNGRIWVQQQRQPYHVRYYDGKAWHHTKIRSRAIIEDDAGRVFLLGVKSIHVLDNDKWGEQPIFDKDNWGHANFVKDHKGPIWFWAGIKRRSTKVEYPGTNGVWSFNRGRWKHHRSDDGFPTNDVRSFVPLGKSRFLVIDADNKKSPSFFVWSPDRKLNKDQSTLFAADETPNWIYYNATDPNGKHFFFATGGKSERFTIDVDGTLSWLTRDEIDVARQMLRGVYENSGRFYSTLDQPRPICPTEPDEIICQDREGRIYFRHSVAKYKNGLGVLWTKFEKPGDVMTSTQTRRMYYVIRDSAGNFWGKPFQDPAVLTKWDGRKWQDVPVKRPPHPYWQNRRGPPWYVWQIQTPVTFSGDNGTLVVCEVRDIYQDAAAELMNGEPVGSTEIFKKAKVHRARRGKDYWFEGWLHKDGQWIGPRPMDKLIAAHRERLMKDFPPAAGKHGRIYQRNFTWGTKQTTPFHIQSDGRRLWVSYDRKVWTYDKDKVLQWKLPNQSESYLSQACFCALADGRMLCSSLTKESGIFQLHALNVVDDRIEADEFPLPDKPQASVGTRWNDWFVFSTRKGSLWLYQGFQTCQFKDGKWLVREDLGRPMFEEPDGTLWFMPGRGHDGWSDEDRGYRIVQGNETQTYAWPRDYAFGQLTLSHSGEIHGSCGYWQITLSAADDPLKRHIKTAWITDRTSGWPAFELEKGVFLRGNGSLGRERMRK